MDLESLEARVMFQTNNDADDLGDYQPHVDDYLNEGYDLLVLAFLNRHLTDEEFLSGLDEPELLPAWSHHAIADYATWMIYRNSNSVKQQRGIQFLTAFNSVQSKLMLGSASGSGGSSGLRFYNMD